MGIGNLTAFLQYLLLIMFSVLTSVLMFILVPRAAVSSGRIVGGARDAAVHPRSGAAGHASGIAAHLGVVEFRDVELQLPGRRAAGPERHLVPCGAGHDDGHRGQHRQRQVDAHQPHPAAVRRDHRPVLVDGIDVREMDREDLWARIGFVPQKSFLFSGTIASNLRYGDEHASDQELWRALDIAQGRDFVASMDGQLDAAVTQGGTNVSGGQRQRLAIARAIVRKAGIFVFDDSFSALDFATDARVRASLSRELSDATVIIVAQRVGTIMNADQIVVMDGGRVVGIGTHSQLLATNETYQEIVYSQLSREEAAA